MLQAAILGLVLTFGQTAPAELRPGRWRAWLDSPGGELPFGLELKKEGDSWKAWLINGEDRAEVPRVEVSANELVLSIPHYASTIRAKASEGGAKLDGEWQKRGRGDKVVKLAFHATAGFHTRFRGRAGDPSALETPPPPHAEKPTRPWTIDGRWSMDEQSSVVVLQTRPNDTVVGTILTPGGDYGFMEGYLAWPAERVSELHLSTFDGSHALLLVARSEDGRTLKGDLWSGDTVHDTWTATRDDAATLPDAFAQTQFSEGAKLSDLKFPDLQGKTRSLDEPAFAGKARIIEVFGSWCPNCNDASRYLVELHRKYKDRGLSVVGLAFEYTGDFARDAEQVKAFAEYHKIEYPLLLAGVADREKASAALPIIDKLRAYPTIILLDAEGKGRAVYTGFSGPATGAEYDKFRAAFEAKVEELLK